MRIIRIRFSKRDEAAYISHLDLQRVMARALRRSGLPVWYSQGFNPHIYLSFSLALPLMQQSEAETVDCKTESERQSFEEYLGPLNEALPKGIKALQIAEPVYAASEIAFAEYSLVYDAPPEKLAEWAAAYAKLPKAEVLRKTKRSEQITDLKQYADTLPVDGEQRAFTLLLPAGSRLNINPELVAEFLCEASLCPVRPQYILRRQVYTENIDIFR